MTVSGVNVTPGYNDLSESSERFCKCHGVPPKLGLPLTFWEPTLLVDVTRHAYKLLGMGGISVGQENVKNRGSVGIVGDGPSQNSFYHVHLYTWPLIAWLDLFADFPCITKGDVEVAYMSELDPLWNDEQLSFIMNGEAALFASPPAQLACIADCSAATANKPVDKLFWCAGCNGSLYPFTGTVAHHVGGLQASSLLLQRVLAKLHRAHVLKGYPQKEFCEAKYMPVINKSLYKTQVVHPAPQVKGPCNALGRSPLVWGNGKSYPMGGEDFVYFVWTKKQCCLDAVKPALAMP